jgi:hypothetical protein
MKRFALGLTLFAACACAARAVAAGDLPESATSLAIARRGEVPVELARQIVVGGGFYYGGAPVYAYRPYYYSYRPYYNYAYRPYYGYGYRYAYPYVYRPYYNYYRPYVYNYGPYFTYSPYVTRYYGGYYGGRRYYAF